jgi:hypothetical protein
MDEKWSKVLFGKKSERFMSRCDSPGMLRWDEELPSTGSDCGRSTKLYILKHRMSNESCLLKGER